MIFNPMIYQVQKSQKPSTSGYEERPSDWLSMPVPQNNEMYLLFHIPDGVSSLLAFTVTCTGNYTVALGTVSNGEFVQQSASSIATGQKYEAELFANNFGDLTSDGFKQVMIKVSGTDILTWEPSTHIKKSAPSSFSNWNIVEIACKLPKATKVRCGNTTTNQALRKMRYFTFFGENGVTDMSSMFYNCSSLVSIPELDTSNVTDMSSMFNSCYALTSIPELDTSKVTNMSGMFYYCSSLTSIPELNTSKVINMSSMFNSCSSLVSIPELDTSKVTNMSSMFSNCYALTKLAFNPNITTWAGYAISLSSCSLGHKALVDFFNSLPTITSSKTLTLTGNPGVSELTDAEKAIATTKNWTLSL